MRCRQNLPSKILALLLGCLAAVAASCPSTQASTAPLTEIHVSLFGQPCLLEGPVSEQTLRVIHTLSPEQLYPVRTLSPNSEPTRKALEKTRALTAIPSALDRYRERLIKRLEAQVVLLEAMEVFGKTHKSLALRTAGKKYLNAKRFREFETEIKKAEALRELSSERGRDLSDQLQDTFSDGIEPDPEEEFHRAIHKMNVQYTCSFEESGEESGKLGGGHGPDAD